MLTTIISIMMQWREVFPQRRTMSRAIRQAIASTVAFGRRTIARVYLITGQSDWTAEYKLHSRSKWQAEDIHAGIKGSAQSNPWRFVAFRN